MEKVLPSNLNYSTLKPVGYPSQIKQEKFTPVSFTNASMSDIIRFNINTNGFWDPYSAYIKIEVDTFGMDPIGLQQLDNSAHNFISTEIERIEEYDTLAAMLVDMNYSPESRCSRKFEGITSTLGISNSPIYGMNPTANSSNATLGGAAVGEAIGGFQPNSIPDVGLNGMKNQRNNYYLASSQYGAVVANDLARYEKAVVSYSSQTVDKAYDNDASGILVGQFTNVFGTYQPQNNTSQDLNTLNSCGYRQPFNYSLSSAGNEETLTPNYLQTCIYKGLIGRQEYKQKTTFCIPLLSGLLGILMPKDSYKYIPMKALQNLILEFRLNPYAMFSSGYQDTLSNVDVATVSQIRRFWKISRFEINVEMQYFEQSIENIILSQLNTDSGIVLHTSSWQLGPRYQIPASVGGTGGGPNGIYQVNLGFESLRNVVWMFLPDDWQNYNYCRKQFRISHNITQYYIKIGTEYYPNLPITGHAGNPISYGNKGSTVTQSNSTSDTDYNNSEFLINLYKCFGKYQDVSTDSFIDSNNFAVNERAYNPAITGALYSVSTGFGNIHTAGGNPLFHENRCIGKAVYALNLEQLNNDYSVISGINTINNRPFEINLKSDNTNSIAFTRPSTMYVFCQYDMLIQLKMSGVQVLGRG